MSTPRFETSVVTVWPYCKYIAKERLKNNITQWHVYEYGPDIELMGAVGELAARRLLGLPEKLHTGHDGGTDFIYKGLRVNVKATHLTPLVNFRHLQWRIINPVNCDIAILVGVDMIIKKARMLGYATREQILKSPVNYKRRYPCHEIQVPELNPNEELINANYLSNRHTVNPGYVRQALYAPVDAGRFVVGAGSHGRRVLTLPR